jgi:hypothetical protein
MTIASVGLPSHTQKTTVIGAGGGSDEEKSSGMDVDQDNELR